MLGNAHAAEQFACARFGGVAVVFGKFGFQFGCVHVVVFGGIRVHVDGVALGHGCPHFAVAHHHHIQYAHVFVGKLVLTQFAQAQALVDGHFAGGGL